MGRSAAKQKSKAVKSEYSFLAIKITGYNAAISAAVNYEVKDPHQYYDDAQVYAFDSRLEIEGICTYPDEHRDEEYSITVYGTDRKSKQFELTLADCQARDDKRLLVYRKVRGKQVPVYNIPKDVGMLEHRRATNSTKKGWTGWLWVPPRTVTDMLTLLPHVHPVPGELLFKR